MPVVNASVFAKHKLGNRGGKSGYSIPEYSNMQNDTVINAMIAPISVNEYNTYAEHNRL